MKYLIIVPILGANSQSYFQGYSFEGQDCSSGDYLCKGSLDLFYDCVEWDDSNYGLLKTC